MTAILTGHCNCGAVAFAVDEPLIGAVFCHCTRCQRRSGTGASPNALLQPGSFRWTAGEGEVVGWSAADGNEKAFCRLCGSHLVSRDRTTGAALSVRLGVIDGDPGVRPQAHQHVASAAAWHPVPDDGLPRFDGPIPLPSRDDAPDAG